VRVAIVGAQATEVAALRELLRNHHEVAWVAPDASGAVQQGKRDPADMVLLVLNGSGIPAADQVRRIMREAPAPILVVTSAMKTDTSAIFSALGAGAIDVIDITPTSGDPSVAANALQAKLDTLRKATGGAHFAKAVRVPSTRGELPKRLVVLGASAGGPAALAAVLSALPANFSAPIVIVQHIDEHFVDGMSEWLDQQCKLTVRTARHADKLEPGTVYIAGGSDHLVLRDRYTLGYRAEPTSHPYRPSIDELFFSVARVWKADAVGVLLTGMGQDGAAGLRSLREAGALTISQDQQSSAVYGIPKAAARLNAAVEILPLSQIGERICEAVRTPSKQRT
jgi:chemotaxis response regulator CheB